jgi:ABC-type transport system involved in multi-copper enzyme maturation permease subunit
MFTKFFGTLRSQWPLWQRQLFVILRLEMGRNFLTPKGLWVFVLAFSPALMAGLRFVFTRDRSTMGSIEDDTLIMAGIFQFFYLRFAFFFGCLGIFVRLFRGEMVDKTLHYYFLAPIRREVLVIGKFLAGCIGSAALFVAGVATCFALVYLHHGSRGAAFLLHERGFWQLGAYLGIAVLGCLGYGAVFLALGLIFKNPVLPAIFYLGWETISGLLPAALQHLSVAFYLKPLFPVDFPITGISGLFTVVVEPTPTWLAVLGLLVFTVVIVTLTAIGIRRTEIEYGGD